MTMPAVIYAYKIPHENGGPSAKCFRQTEGDRRPSEYGHTKYIRSEIAEARIEKLEKALRDVEVRALRIKEDKAVVGIEATFIRRVASEALQDAEVGG